MPAWRRLHAHRRPLGLWRAAVAVACGLRDTRRIEALERAGIIERWEPVEAAVRKLRPHLRPRPQKIVQKF